MDDYRQSDEYCRYFYTKGWKTENIGSTKILVKELPLLGAILRIQRGPADTSLTEIDAFAKKINAAMLFVESDIHTKNVKYAEFEKSLNAFGYKNIKLFLSPTKTTCIDLSKTEDELLSGFDQDIRKSIKTNLAKNIVIKVETCSDNFYNIVSEASHKGGFFMDSLKDWKAKWEPFGSQVQFMLAYLDGNLLGGNMFTVQPPIAYGLSLPSTELGKDTHIAATLIWEGLKKAKELGCSTFDLNGLYDERYKAPIKWRGLTEFKRKFRGQEIEFMHPKIKVYKWYLKPLERLGLIWMFFVDP